MGEGIIKEIGIKGARRLFVLLENEYGDGNKCCIGNILLYKCKFVCF